MKNILTKKLVVVILSLVGAKSYAGTVDVSGCSWEAVYANTYVQISALQCDGFTPLTRQISGYNREACSLSASSGYTVSGTCDSFIVSSSTESSASSSASVSACVASGKAGVYVTSGSSSGVVSAAAQAGAYCSPCGVDSRTSNSYSYSFYCSSY